VKVTLSPTLSSLKSTPTTASAWKNSRSLRPTRLMKPDDRSPSSAITPLLCMEKRVCVTYQVPKAPFRALSIVG